MSSTPEEQKDSAPISEQPISLYEKHKVVYVREVKGWWANWRWALVVFTQLIFYGTPWLQWNDRQAVLFHLVERKFYLFGMVLWPQDVFYLALLLIVSAYALFLFTAVAGRLFCGYACPQTVYTEMFMWIENRIEGDRPARLRLDRGAWNGAKVAKKSAKHLAWIILSLWTGFTLVGYFTPVSELMHEVQTFSMGGWEIFWTFFYAGFCYMQAGFLREQVCKYMCPYARFQGVMFDADTLVITYDPERGEPRGPRKKGVDAKAAGLGDCIDCGICVQVCPTGIDIRDGLQYECIGCAACIDGCDQVMEKVGLPKGLIRYSTENALEKHYTHKEIVAHVLRPRVIMYSVGLLAIIAATVWSLAVRVPLKVDVTRDRGTLAREADDGRIENIYTLKIMNTQEVPHRYALSVSGLDGVELIGERIVEVGGAQNREVPVAVRVAPEAGKKGANTIYFEIKAMNHEKIAVQEKASFLLP